MRCVQKIELCAIFLLFFWNVRCSEKVPRIAVVGGGIGGASTTHFLEGLFGKDGVKIDLYESNLIGGRLATVEVGNHEFELGGSVIHSQNKYMEDFIKLLGLKHRDEVPSKFGLYDGTEFVFAEFSNWKIVNSIKLFWRYGYGVYKLKSHIEDMLRNFGRIYSLQAKGHAYLTVTELLNAMSPEFVKNLRTSTKNGFKTIGFSDKVIDEIIKATLIVNYGQSTDVHKFVGAVSVAGIGNHLWAVSGGNRLIPQKLLEKSSANIIKAHVSKITLQENSRFALHWSDSERGDDSVYDIVILARPFAENIMGIEFINFPVQFSFPGQYHQTVCTIVTGTLNYTYFGFSSPTDQLDEILLTDNDLFFSSIGRIYPIDYKASEKSTVPYTWKIFSHVPLHDDQLDSLFTIRTNVQVKNWLAYPHYSSNLRSDNFVLHKNLYHVNGIEWAASAMEMSALGAKNVALLAYHDWKGKKPPNLRESVREEL